MFHSLSKHSGAIVVHLIGCTVTAALLCLVIAEPGHTQLIAAHLGESQVWQHNRYADLILLFALGAGVWFLLMLVRARVTSFRSRDLVVSRATGTVMTETLIVMPVLLLIVLGLIQLAVINICGILTNVATFQAARTGMLWTGEAEHNRAFVNSGSVREAAKISAAAVLAPVAAGDYAHDIFSGSPNFQRARASFVANQLPILSNDAGVMGLGAAFFLQLEDLGSLTNNSPNVATSFDTSSFRLRSVRKFTMAYHSTNVRVTRTSSEVTTMVSHNLFLGMPFVGRVFGHVTSVGGRSGFFTPIEREMTMPLALDANPSFPRL